MKKSFNINRYNNIPKGLKKADYVDLLLFQIGLKPCVRLGSTDKRAVTQMKLWCKQNKYKFCLTNENYFYISKYKLIAYITMKVDNSFFEHTYLLGRLLGYPKCCCKKIKEIGEVNIDFWEKEFCKQSVFSGEYKLINPEGYINGESFISHIPCSDSCKASLKIAKTVFSVVNDNKDYDCFDLWKKWFE